MKKEGNYRKTFQGSRLVNVEIIQVENGFISTVVSKQLISMNVCGNAHHCTIARTDEGNENVGVDSYQDGRRAEADKIDANRNGGEGNNVSDTDGNGVKTDHGDM